VGKILSKTISQVSKRWVAIILVVLAALVVYSNIYHHPFVYDDTKVTYTSEETKDLSNFWPPSKLLKPRRIVYLTFALNYRWGGYDVVGYHLVNVIIHVLSGVTVYLLALILLGLMVTKNAPKKKLPAGLPVPVLALFSALVFTVHPLQTQAVTYTVQRLTSMAALFYILSVFLYLKGRLSMSLKNGSRLRPWLFFILAFIAGCLAVLSKRSATSLPGVILFAEYLCFEAPWAVWRKRLLWCTAVAVLWILIIGISAGFLKQVNKRGSIGAALLRLSRSDRNISRWVYLCTQFNVVSHYVRLLFLPVNQNLDHRYPLKSGFTDDLTPLAFLFLLGILSLGVWSRKRHPLVTFSILWFFITLSVESSIFPIHDPMFEHRLYLPMVGFALLIPFIISRLLASRRNAALVIIVLVTVALGTATYLRNRVWADHYTLWSDVIRKSPHNHRAFNALGRILAVKDDYEGAVEKYRRSIELKATYAEPHHNLGVAFWKLDRLDEALASLERAVELDSDYAEAYMNLARVTIDQERYGKALEYSEQAIRLDPDYAKAHFVKGAILGKMGKTAAALVCLEKSIELEPDNVQTLLAMGSALVLDGRADEAVESYHLVLEIEPENTEAHRKLGKLFFSRGLYPEAVENYRKALDIEPESAATLIGLADALYASGDLDEAAELCMKAVSLAPDSASAYEILALVNLKRRNFAETIRYFRESLQHGPGSAGTHNNLGYLLCRTGDIVGAVRHCSRAVELKPDYAEARFNLATALFHQGDLTGTIEHCRRALALKPDLSGVGSLLAETYNHLGVQRIHEKKVDEATDCFRKALECNPGNADAHNNLGNVLFSSGKHQEAITHYSEALRLKPDFKQAAQNLERVRKKLSR